MSCSRAVLSMTNRALCDSDGGTPSTMFGSCGLLCGAWRRVVALVDRPRPSTWVQFGVPRWAWYSLTGRSICLRRLCVRLRQRGRAFAILPGDRAARPDRTNRATPRRGTLFALYYARTAPVARARARHAAEIKPKIDRTAAVIIGTPRLVRCGRTCLICRKLNVRLGRARASPSAPLPARARGGGGRRAPLRAYTYTTRRKPNGKR